MKRDLAWFKARADRGDFSVVDLSEQEVAALRSEALALAQASGEGPRWSSTGPTLPPGCKGTIAGIPIRVQDVPPPFARAVRFPPTRDP